MRYEEWLRSYLPFSQIAAVTLATASEYAEIRIAMRRMGQPIPLNDVWIAALARQHSLPAIELRLAFRCRPRSPAYRLVNPSRPSRETGSSVWMPAGGTLGPVRAVVPRKAADAAAPGGLIAPLALGPPHALKVFAGSLGTGILAGSTVTSAASRRRLGEPGHH